MPVALGAGPQMSKRRNQKSEGKGTGNGESKAEN